MGSCHQLFEIVAFLIGLHPFIEIDSLPFSTRFFTGYDNGRRDSIFSIRIVLPFFENLIAFMIEVPEEW